MSQFKWGPFPKERSPKGWIVTAVALLLVLGALTGGLFSFSSRPPTSAHAQGATGSWSLTTPLPAARTKHTATVLANGKVLVAGGFGSSSIQATAYLYDPATAMWTQTGSMQVARAEHTATLLPNGKVLVTGGSTPTGVTATAELYDPSTGTWTQTGSMQTVRTNHTATLLANGKVLVAGGYIFNPETNHALTSAELYDPATGTWTATGSMQVSVFPEDGQAATLLPNGKVLVVAAFSSPAAANLYDPATGTWTTTGSLTGSMEMPTVTSLTTGQVLVVSSDNAPQIYDPVTNTWTTAGSLHTAREGGTATLLANGKVLVVSGRAPSSGPFLASAELFDPLASPPPPTPRLEVVTINTVNGEVEHEWSDDNGTTWSGLAGLGTLNDGSTFIGAPAAISDGTRRLNVFAVDSFRHNVYQMISNNGQWSDWSRVPGQTGADPAVAISCAASISPTNVCHYAINTGPTVSSWGAGRMDLFVVALRQEDHIQVLLHTWADNSTWSGNWEVLGTGVQGNPTAVSWGPGRIDVFARGGNNELEHTWFDNGRWFALENLGGILTSDPSVASSGSGRLNIFVRDTSGQLQTKGFAGDWSDWNLVGGLLAPVYGSVAAVSPGLLTVDVFVIGTDNSLFRKVDNQPIGWADWQSINHYIDYTNLATAAWFPVR